MLIGCNLGGWPSFTWLLVRKIISKSKFYFHNALILYIYLACLSNSQVSFCYFFDITLNLIPYTLQSLFFIFLLYFIFLQTFELTALNFSISKSTLFSFFFFPVFELLLLVLLFQNQILDSTSILLISAVLSLLSFILGYELITKLVSNFFFLQALIIRALANLK